MESQLMLYEVSLSYKVDRLDKEKEKYTRQASCPKKDAAFHLHLTKLNSLSHKDKQSEMNELR